MPRTLATVSLCLVVALSLAACAEIEVRFDYDRTTAFDKLHTYAWAPRRAPARQDPRVDAAFLETVVREAADRELAAKGYRLAGSGKPDFLLAYRAVVELKTDERSINESTGYSSGWWSKRDDEDAGTADSGGLYADEYDQGVLRIDVIEAATSNIVWRGSAATEVVFDSDSRRRRRNIERVVAALLDGFPPQ